MKKLLIIGSILLVGGLQASSDTVVSNEDHVYLNEAKASPRHKQSIWGGSAAVMANDVYVTEHRNKLASGGKRRFLLETLLGLTSSACVLSEEDAPKVHAMIAKNAKALGVAKPIIMLGDSKSMYNAMAASFSRDAGVIFIYENLMEDMTDGEFEGIICHELAHIKHNDVSKRLIATIITQLLAGYVVAATHQEGDLTVSEAKRLYLKASVGLIELTPDQLVKVGKIIAKVALVNVTASLFSAKLSRLKEKNADIGGAYNKEQARNLISGMRKFQEKKDIKDKAWDNTIETIKNCKGLTKWQSRYYLFRAQLNKSSSNNLLARLMGSVGEFYASHPKTTDRIAYLIEHEKTLTQ